MRCAAPCLPCTQGVRSANRAFLLAQMRTASVHIYDIGACRECASKYSALTNLHSQHRTLPRCLCNSSAAAVQRAQCRASSARAASGAHRAPAQRLCDWRQQQQCKKARHPRNDDNHVARQLAHVDAQLLGYDVTVYAAERAQTLHRQRILAVLQHSTTMSHVGHCDQQHTSGWLPNSYRVHRHAKLPSDQGAERMLNRLFVPMQMYTRKI